MKQLTKFGKDVKKKLIDISQTQEWLISQVTAQTGLFVDAGYMYKILTGQREAPKIVQAVRSILDLPEDEQKAG